LCDKETVFYGVRVHVVACRQAGTLPCSEYIGVTSASEHDSKVFDYIRPFLQNNELYGDTVYPLLFLVFVSQLRLYLGGLKRKQGLNARVRFALIVG
jgi:hypothetical protein